MLKSINPLLTGPLLAILADMGHGDEIVIADANFPADALAQRLIQMPGISATQVQEAVLSLFPLDEFVDMPTAVMRVPEGNGRAPIYDEFDKISADAEGKPVGLELIDRFAFYDRAKEAYAIISTGERRIYANIILKKGIIRA
ncbi:RbsD/FucU family protein [Rhizobium sp. SG2393]|uniref:RbsD/FucU family protein n=1 Tax=Rhizobium sp. SG2393 TaxID=3276279 RepID=UPI00366D5D9D